jgi:DNA excision repair protein ERCC-6-like 2
MAKDRSAQRYFESTLFPFTHSPLSQRELALGRSASKKLKEKLSEFVLRRDKKIIADKLPSKEDRIVFCPLTEMQMKVYKRILELPEIVALKQSARKCFCGSGRANGECHGSW